MRHPHQRPPALNRISCSAGHYERNGHGNSFPRLDFESFDAFEFPGVCSDEGGAEAASLGGDQKIERTDGFSGRFQRGADVGVMLSRFEGEIRDPEKAQKSFETPGLMRMRPQILLHAGPKFRGNDYRDAGEGWVRQLSEAGLVAQHWDADARIKEEGWFHCASGSKLKNGALVSRRTRRRFGKVFCIRKFLGEEARNLRE